ncbi:hypothetical protein BAMA_11220 [Bacillus manliponensis]|uniref:TPR repeat protein n=1 Tax=Bacillus manliponensis TaxID=574376 RepID=A0A073JU09_9BACI|nr:hypothetical protein [Bacillus manliponensis]KEK17795.1 hypothetical protein BAMA_11220 [Bacillus manliponensis]
MNKKESTVVLFPHLSARYVEEGFAALKERQFEKALSCFDSLRQYEAHTEQSELAAVICLLELKEMKEARERCEELFQTGTLLFGDILETYVTILVQMNDYEGMIETVETVLQTKEITDEQREKLAQLALFAKSMIDSEGNNQVDDGSLFDKELFVHDLHANNYGQQLRAIQRISSHNVEQVLPLLSEFLVDETKHPYIKTSILHILMECGVEEEIEVEKFGERITVVPQTLQVDDTFTNEVLHMLSTHVESDNPTLYETIVTYWKEMQVSVFPIPLFTDKIEVWAAVLERIGRKRFGMTINEADLLFTYNITIEELHVAYKWFLRIEKEGYMPV